MNLSFCTDNLAKGAILTISGAWLEDADFPKANLACQRISKRAGFDTAKSGEIVIDLGLANPASVNALMNHNLTSGATVTIQGNSSDLWTAPPFSQSLSFRVLDMYDMFTAETWRYWRLVVDDTGRLLADIRIGELILGTLTELDRNYDWDLKEEQAYKNIVHETEGGNFWSYELFDRKSWTMKFSDLTGLQLDEIKALMEAVRGNAYPFLAVMESMPYYVRIQESIGTSRPMQRSDLEFWGEDFFPVDYMIDSLTLQEETRGINI